VFASMKAKRWLSAILCLVLFIGLFPTIPVKAEEPSAMKASPEMIAVLKQMEGFSAYPYWDYAQWSVGYGTRCPDDKLSEYQQNGITEEIALSLLQQELTKFEADVNKFIDTYQLKLKQNQFDALVSFSYNCGSAWMQETTGYFNTAVRSGDMGSALIYGICLFSTAGGEYILVERRMCEAYMYINGIYKASNAEGETFPSNFKWVHLDGGGGRVRYAIYGYDAKQKSPVNAAFATIPTGVDANGNPFVYELAGWYTAEGRKVDVLDSSLRNGQVIYARWKDNTGKVVTLPTGTPVTQKTISVTRDSVNLRSGPATYYPLEGTAAKGSTLTLTEVFEASGYQWGKTNMGWIRLDFTSYTPEVKPENFPKHGTVNASDVRYRTGPSTDASTVGRKQIGDRVTITEIAVGDSLTWGKMTDGNWICLDYVTFDEKAVTGIQLLRLPDKLNYKDINDPLVLEGSVLQIRYSDGTYGAKTLTRDMVSSYKASGKEKAIVTITYEGKSLTFDVYLIDRTPLVITQQPRNATAAVGQTATVSINAQGDGVQYLWYLQAPGDTKFQKTAITTNTYTCTMTEDLEGSRLYCVVTDKFGFSVTSDTATLRKPVAVSILRQPQDIAVSEGQIVSVKIAAEGDGLRYDWYVQKPGMAAFGKAAATKETFSHEMDQAFSGSRVYCVITDRYGNSVTSDTVTLRMTESLNILSQPQSVQVAPGKDVRLTVRAEGKDLQYRWYVCAPGDNRFVDTDVTTSRYTCQMTQQLTGSRLFCVITDAFGQQVQTDTVTISAPQQDKPALQPQITLTQTDGVLQAVVTSQEEGLRYQWYIAKDTDTVFTCDTAASDSFYRFPADGSCAGFRVYCVVTDSAGYHAATDTVVLPGTNLLAILRQPQGGAIPIGEKVTVSVSAQGESLHYAWFVKAPGATEFEKVPVAGNRYIFSMTAANDGMEVYCVITDRFGNQVQTDTVCFTKFDGALEAAGTALRLQMEARQPEIRVTYFSETPVEDPDALCMEIFNTAIAHTGVPTQGDYLYHHLKSLKFDSVVSETEGGYLLTASFTVTYRTTAQQEQLVEEKVAQILDALDLYNASDYEKIQGIYQYLCSHVTRDMVGAAAGDPAIYTAYGALVGESAVCQGFASAFYRLALELGVDTRILSGRKGSTRHGWNIVKLDGKYYHVDATSDAGFPPAQYSHFLKCDASLAGYVRNAEFLTAEFLTAYPMASKDY